MSPSDSSDDLPSSRPKKRALKEPCHEELSRIDRKLLRLFDDRNALIQNQVREQDSTGRSLGHVRDAATNIDQLVDDFEHPETHCPLPKADRRNLLKHLSSVCLRSIRPLQAAYLGPKHSYSHLAAIKYFGEATPLVPMTSIPDVFAAVEQGDLATGIVPIENSTDGRVVDTLSMFIRRETEICGEVRLPIHHNLLSMTPREQIKEVHSKPQALSQCRLWLARNLPNAQLVEVSSTATAARSAAQNNGVAAIASLQAGQENDLDVLQANIEDNPNNVTRFAVLGLDRPDPTGHDKTAILFQVHHQPGALADAMTIFKDQSLNLTWIESFPDPVEPDEYLFFVELKGHRNQRTVQAAVDQLTKKSLRLTILGSYPKAK